MTTSAFFVRAALAADAGTLTALRAALFQELDHTSSLSPRAFERTAADSFVAGLEGGWCHAWLAEAGGRLAIGSAALLVLPRLPSPQALAQREGYLLSVYTVPEWRRRGVARALLDHAIAKARELGLARIRLHTTPPGRRVYAAAGFLPRIDEMELTL